MEQYALAARRAVVLHRLRRARLWLLLVLSGVALALFPWTAYLSATLPSEHVTHHWQVAWAGFDLFEAGALVATVVGILRRSSLVPFLAAVAGTALLCDAWFDTVTATPGRDLGWSLLEGVVGEVPLAALCFWIAFEVSVVFGTTVAVARSVSATAPLPTAPPGPPAAGPDAPRTSGSAAPNEGRTSR